jgi:putative tricarboxylic transport membrane protein
MGDWTTFASRPLSGSLLAIAAALLVVPPLWRKLSGR